MVATGITLAGCNSGVNAPDVSGIKVELQTERFEQDFFAIDTNNVFVSLQQLQAKYPGFANDFVVNILGIPLLPHPDTTVDRLVKKFIGDYKLIKDTSDKVFKSFDDITSEVKKGLKFTRHYFPQYKIPTKLITFVGPLDSYFQGSLGAYGDIITNDGLAIGLQLHLGKGFSV